jgi:Uncharacterised protein family (UPF0175)
MIGHMTVSIGIPDSVAEQMMASGKELSRTVLESMALEGYRNRVLSEGNLCEMLGLESRMQVHDFLWEHGVELNYSWEDWQQDKATVDKLAKLRLAEKA